VTIDEANAIIVQRNNEMRPSQGIEVWFGIIDCFSNDLFLKLNAGNRKELMYRRIEFTYLMIFESAFSFKDGLMRSPHSADTIGSIRSPAEKLTGFERR
jgi:hypothetical protein